MPPKKKKVAPQPPAPKKTVKEKSTVGKKKKAASTSKKVVPAPVVATPVAEAPAQPVVGEASTTGPPPLDPGLAPVERLRILWADPPRPDVTVSKVRIVYSTYKTEFECRAHEGKGSVRWTDIDNEYALSFVFAGDFGKRLRAVPADAKTIPSDAPVLNLVAGALGVGDDGERDYSKDELYFDGIDLAFAGRYELQIDESDAGLNIETRDGPIVFADNPNGGAELCIGQGARKEGCSCLYGNPCADPEACQDWHHRFEVAKKNGWKGYS